MSRRILYIFLLFVYLFCSSASAKTWLIKLRSRPSLAKSFDARQTGHAAVDALLDKHHAAAVRPVFAASASMSQIPEPLAAWIAVDMTDDAATSETLNELELLNDVIVVQENRLFRLSFIPNDSLYADQYALHIINAEKAWDIQRGDRKVIVAVIDTGIDYQHPELIENVWINPGEDVNGNGFVDALDFNGLDDDGNGFVDDIRGWDFTDAPNYPSGGDFLERDNDPMDEHGHGTGVSGLIAAKADNQTGIAGLAHNCRVMALRSFNANGYGEEDDAASAILYAVANGAQIINMSFGDTFVSHVLNDVISYAAAQGVVLVASSGNSSTDQIHYPSGFAETISVGATDENDQLAGYSNFGPTVDLTAPGSSVLGLDLHSAYRIWDGTSFSAPYVSAAAALLLSQRPGLTPEVVRSILVNSADDLGDPGWDDKFGAGRLNVSRLLTQPQHTLVHISEPGLDAGFSAGPIDIYGSAWSPDFSHYQLFWGQSSNPVSWQAIGEPAEMPVIDGRLGVWSDLPEQEGDYTLKLTATTNSGQETTCATRIFLDWSPPVVSSLDFLPMLHGDGRSVLMQLVTDDLCQGSLFYSINNSDFIEAPLTYRTRELRYNLSQEQAQGQVKAWVQLTNSAGLSTTIDNNGHYYNLDLDASPIDVTGFTQTDLLLPFGRLLAKTPDFNQNGAPELVTSVSQNGAIGPVTMFEMSDTGMQPVFATGDPLIPRDIGDPDGDGKMEMLCGFGFHSYLYEASLPGGFPENQTVAWEGDGAQQYWASRFADLDQDGRGEVIMRVVRPQEEGGTDQFELFENNGDDLYDFVAAFANPTPGENFNGVPHCQIADFDGDGALEILLGDSDGDVFIYENSGDNSYRSTWLDSLPLLDSIGYLATGDFDGDGVQEFIVGCHSDPNLNTEHDYDARHWYYRLYDRFSDDDYRQAAEWRIFGFEPPRDYLSSVTVGDVDGDSDDEILIAAYPDFYIIDYIDTSYEVVYHHAPVQTSAALVADVNLDGKNEIWLGDGEFLFALEAVGQGSGPATPVGVVAQPLGAARVKLTWRETLAAESYRLFRGAAADSLNLLAEVQTNFYLDDAVQRDERYYYAVQTVDSKKTPSQSRLSKIVSARPGDPPFILNAEQESGRAVRLTFSEPMNRSIQLASNYAVNNGIGRPSSVGHDKSGREALLTFAALLPENEYIITCANLQDSDNTPMPNDQNTIAFTVTSASPSPWLVDAAFISSSRIDLIFDQAMDKTTAEQPGNYAVNEHYLVEKATLVGEEKKTVQLFATDFRQAAVDGDTLLLRVMNLKSSSGKTIKRGRGDMALLVLPASTAGAFRVYPNPVVLQGENRAVTFANVRENDFVQILSARGRRVRTLQKQSGDGDLLWDVRNSSGEFVASGVYIYRLVSQSGERMGKLAVVR